MSEVCEDHLLKTQHNFQLCIEFFCAQTKSRMKEECFTHHPNQAEDLTTAYCPAVGIMETLEERTKISLPSILENRSWQNQMETKFLTVFHEKHHTKDRLEDHKLFN